MDNESEVIVHLGIEIFGAIIVAIFVTAACSIARAGYKQLNYEREIINDMKSRYNLTEYSGEMTTDDIIKFIITYGDKYMYVVKKKENVTYVRKDISTIASDNMVAGMKDKGLLNTLNYQMKLSFDPAEMIELFADDAINGVKYSLRAISLDFSVDDIKNGENVAYILIEEQ